MSTTPPRTPVPLTDASRIDPGELAALNRLVAAARALVRCADEFLPEYPSALDERLDELADAQAELDRLYDEPTQEPPPPLQMPLFPPVRAERHG